MWFPRGETWGGVQKNLYSTQPVLKLKTYYTIRKEDNYINREGALFYSCSLCHTDQPLLYKFLKFVVVIRFCEPCMSYFFYRPLEFLHCDDLIDHKGNKTAKEDQDGYGCVKVKYLIVLYSSLLCCRLWTMTLFLSILLHVLLMLCLC